MYESLEFAVKRNEVQEPFDGGRLVLRCTNPPEGVRQMELIVNANTDAFLAQFGQDRQSMEECCVRLSIHIETSGEQ